jgi:hypothetical protein
MADTYRSKINENFVYVISNFKVVESTKYRPVSNENKITFVYNTKVKEMKGASDNFSDYYFEFAAKNTLEERKEKDKQCSGMFIVILLNSKWFIIFNTNGGGYSSLIYTIVNHPSRNFNSILKTSSKSFFQTQPILRK